MPTNQPTKLLWIVILVLCVVLSLMTVCVYKARQVLHERITIKFGGPSIGFLGDSITAGVGVWDWQLGRFTFDTMNFGQSSAGIEVISWLAKVRVIPLNNISTISIMSGANDGPNVTDPLSIPDVDKTLEVYLDLLQYLKKNGVSKIIVTSAPPQVDKEKNQFIRQLNNGLRKFVESDSSFVYIDLWPLLSDGERIRPEMTVDGVHFTPLANSIWSEQLKKHI